MLVEKPLLLLFELLLELKDDLVLFLFKFPHELVEAVGYVVKLLFEQASQFLLDLLDHFGIVLDEPLDIVNHLSEVYHVLLHRVCYSVCLKKQSYPSLRLA